MPAFSFYQFCFFVFILIEFCSLNAFSQEACDRSQNKKAQKYFEEAGLLYKNRKYDEARSIIAKAIQEDPEWADAYLLQGQLALKKKDDAGMERNFLKAIELCPDIDAEPYFQLGWLYFDNKKYKQAETQLRKFLEFDKLNEEHASKAEHMLTKAKLYANPVPFEPKPVKDISTPDPEYLPYISPDNELAFFTRRFEMKDKNMLTPQSVEKFMIARRYDGAGFDRGVPMDAPFNRSSSNNEGGATITIDNRYLFFTVNDKGNFDICMSEYFNGHWSEIENLGPKVNDPKQWDSQPTISSDGKTLYFASARDSLTGIDIYKTVRDDQGNWSKAVKLGAPINTNGNEKSPFLHSDSRTLYFSSDSLPGLGGYDIFMSKMDDQGRWGKPVNLGYPINTSADEVGFFVSTDGRTGYFASNKINGGVGGYDIYSFLLYPEVRPNKVYFQKGDLNSGQDEEPVAATLEIRDAITRKLTKIDVDSVTGKYAFVVDFDNDLILSIKKEGYAFESQYISSRNEENTDPIKRNFQLKKLEVGEQYTINDILFATNSYELNDTIKSVLQEFVDYLKRNPNLQVAIHGHTDNVGKPSDNMVLSENRAKRVFDFLVREGIQEKRLKYKGFGETRPIASNSTESGRANNRRTVFVVTSK